MDQLVVSFSGYICELVWEKELGTERDHHNDRITSEYKSVPCAECNMLVLLCILKGKD